MGYEAFPSAEAADISGNFNTANASALDNYGPHAGMQTAMAPISSGSHKPIIDPKTGGPVGGGIVG